MTSRRRSGPPTKGWFIVLRRNRWGGGWSGLPDGLRGNPCHGHTEVAPGKIFVRSWIIATEEGVSVALVGLYGCGANMAGMSATVDQQSIRRDVKIRR
ncbi:protein of unknown function [Pararobbsia alpina]